MFLSRLVISNFRNIRHADLLPSEGVNFIFGNNGSGKTSLLEAIYSLSRGHSFRSRKYTDLIGYDTDGFVLYAEVDLPDRQLKVGLSRPRVTPSHFKLDGRTVQSVQELVALMPTQIIDANAFLLLEGGPKARRMFLDWLVFHVKHDFGEIWRQYTRALKQRNSLLRRGNIAITDFRPWDVELARFGSLMDRYRRETLIEFIPRLETLLSETESLAPLSVSVRYSPGWDVQSDLQEQLGAGLDKDRKLGFTSIGPHKSDLMIRCHGKVPTSFLSRGQQKTLICALHMAQINSLFETTGKHSLVLVDDLAAELDRPNRGLLCQWLSSTGCQVFVSGVETAGIAEAWPNQQLKNAKMFHVKHGVVVEQNKSLGAENDPE